jgi:hypothetical protein
MKRYVFFSKRIGWRWQVWFYIEDQHGLIQSDPHNGAQEWMASTLWFWRRLNCERMVTDLMHAYNLGVWNATEPLK